MTCIRRVCRVCGGCCMYSIWRVRVECPIGTLRTTLYDMNIQCCVFCGTFCYLWSCVWSDVCYYVCVIMCVLFCVVWLRHMWAVPMSSYLQHTVPHVVCATHCTTLHLTTPHTPHHTPNTPQHTATVLCRCRKHGVTVGVRGRVVVESCSIFENTEHGIMAHAASSSLLVNRSR